MKKKGEESSSSSEAREMFDDAAPYAEELEKTNFLMTGLNALKKVFSK